MTTACLPVISADLVRAAKRWDERPERWTDETIHNALDRYRKFLTLCMLHPDKSIAPSRDIDAMWHLHMLNPRAYYQDCQQMFGDILDHDGGFGADPEELPILERTFAETAALYREEFGEDYTPEGMGDAATRADGMTRCTRNCVSRCQRACKTK